jgi:hypothetical protein
MAEIVQSLFGVSPEMYQRQQQDRIDAQALRFAQLDPFQQANFAIGRGANMLGGAIGGALGGQDPELQRITRRQQIAGSLNPNDLSTFEQAFNALAPTDPQGAMMVRAELEKVQMGQAKLASEGALARQRDAAATASLREKEGVDPVQQILRTGKFTPASVSAYQKSGEIADLKPIDSATKTQVVETAGGQLLVDMGTGQTIANLGAAPDRRSVTKVSVGAEIKQAPDIVRAISDFGKSVEPAMTAMQTAQNATTLINQAVRDRNSQAFEAARTTLAKLVGENKLSNEDIRRTGIDPRLVQGALDWVNKKIEGVPNEDIMKQMFAVAKALENSAATKIDTQADRAQAAAKASNFPGDPNLYFPRATPIAAGGTDAAKEARYQAFKRAQEGKRP